MFLAALWIAGRICVTFSVQTGWLAAMLVDTGFLLLVGAAAAREIVAGRKWNNLSIVVLILVLLAGNVAFHLEAHFNASADIGIRVGIGVIVLLISLIGGRIIPSFTRNWLVRENPGRLPAPFAKFDILCIVVGAIAMVMWIFWPIGRATGGSLVLAGLMHAVRLVRWAGDRTIRERLLFVLHVGYAFVPLGFVLNACSAFGVVPASAGVHAWMIGAAGVMTLAVMTRATLGHTGQQLKASVTTQAIYASVIVAAIARICAVFEPSHALVLLLVAAIAWSVAFLGFAICYGPTLLGSRK